MNDFGENVKDFLLQSRAMPTNHFTHALKQINSSEDGKMVDSIYRKRALIEASFLFTVLGL